MLTVELRPQLAERLNLEAERQQTSIVELVNDWLEDGLWRQRTNKIRAEAKRFQARHAELYAQYAGKHIAMRDGVVLDHDDDIYPLYTRIRARYGDEPILITPVMREPIPTYRILSPKWQQEEE